MSQKYSIEKYRGLGLTKGRWTEEFIRQLKSAMDEWIENLPAHRALVF